MFEQVAQSCRMLSMEADVGCAVDCSDRYDFCIVGVDEAVAALRCTAAFPCVLLILRLFHLAFVSRNTHSIATHGIVPLIMMFHRPLLRDLPMHMQHSFPQCHWGPHRFA